MSTLQRQLKRRRLDKSEGKEVNRFVAVELATKERIEKYGPGSESLSDAQLELLELEPGVSSAEVEAESERAQLKLPLKRTKKASGRQIRVAVVNSFFVLEKTSRFTLRTHNEWSGEIDRLG